MSYTYKVNEDVRHLRQGPQGRAASDRPTIYTIVQLMPIVFSVIWRAPLVLNDRENILSALGEKPLTVYQIMRRANVANAEACQALLLKMRDEGLVKFDIHTGRWLIGNSRKSRHHPALITEHSLRAPTASASA